MFVLMLNPHLIKSLGGLKALVGRVKIIDMVTKYHNNMLMLIFLATF
jgi:hypothetical protein